MSGIIPLGGPAFIAPLGPSPLGGDMHETFKFDRYDNLYSGHTTVRIPGGHDVQMPWQR